MEEGPDDDIKDYDESSGDAVHHEDIERNEEDSEEEDTSESLMLIHTCLHETMMDMVLVGGEDWLVETNTENDNADHVEYRNNKQREGLYHVVRFDTGELCLTSGVFEEQESEDIAKSKAAGISHEYLHAALGTGEKIEAEERSEYSH